MTMLPTVRESLVSAAAAGAPARERRATASPQRSVPSAWVPSPRPAAVWRAARRERRLAAVAAGALGALALTAILLLPGARAGDGRAPRGAMMAAIGSGSVSGTGVWRAATAIARVTPYPPGTRDSLAWVRPLVADDQPVARRALAVSLQRRAMCQWYRYWLVSSGGSRSAATAVLETIPAWPAVSAGASRAAAVALAAAARAGDAGPIHAHLALEC
jgi:hypothetical protein